MHTQSRRSYGLARSVGVLLVFAALAGCGSNTGSSVALGPSIMGEALTPQERAEVQSILAEPASSAGFVSQMAAVIGERDRKPAIRYAAIRKLEEGAQPRAVGVLSHVAEDPGDSPVERFLIENAITALVRIGRADARAALVALLQDGASYKKELTVKLLGQFGTGADLPLLDIAMSGSDPVVRAWAKQARSRIEAR